MLKLFKYLKPYTLSIAACIILLFAQAWAELSLPDYMSNIVNKGIQQSGIETAIPEALSGETFSDIQAVTPYEDWEFFTGCYRPYSPFSSYRVLEEQDIIAKFPKISENFMSEEKHPHTYILQLDLSEEDKEKLENIAAKALLIVKGEEIAVQNEDSELAMDFTSFGMDMQDVPENASFLDILKSMPEEQRFAIINEIQKPMDAMGDIMIRQAATAAVKLEYELLGADTNKIQIEYILHIGILMLLITIGGGLASIIVGMFAARIGAGFSRDLRTGMFTKVESFSNSEFDKFSTASLITRSTNDIFQIQLGLIMLLRMFLYAPIMGIGGVQHALNKSSSMSWIILLAVGILSCIIIAIYIVIAPKFNIVQTLTDKLNLVMRENLSGIMVIRSYNTQKFEEQRFDKANMELTKTNLFINRIMAGMMPIMILIMNGIAALILWVGAKQIAESSLQIGDLMAFIQYTMQIVMAFVMTAMIFIFLPRIIVSMKRVSEVLNTESSIKDIEKSSDKFNKDDVKGIIEFNNVSFKFPGAEEYTLKNITFTALPGQTTAFIGPTGSGKSTIVNLLPRFYDVTEGNITLDSIDIRELTKHDLREQIGFVPQQGTLFSGTVKSNLKYGKPNATQEDMQKAAETAQAAKFIQEKEGEYDYEISQDGTNVSGGQRQRLSIARALVKNAPVYIFDDTFSALDFKTDAKLRAALKEEITQSTILLVAQRVGTIMNADQIIVLDEGEVVGIGTHQTLMENCKTYKEIAESQIR